MQHNTFQDDIPIVAVLKAMGMETDQEVMQLLGNDDQTVLNVRHIMHTELLQASAFIPSLEECASLGVFTQAQAVMYVGSKIRAPRRNFPSRKSKEVSADIIVVFST